LLTFGKRFDISHRSTTAKGHPLHKGYEHSTKHLPPHQRVVKSEGSFVKSLINLFYAFVGWIWFPLVYAMPIIVMFMSV